MTGTIAGHFFLFWNLNQKHLLMRIIFMFIIVLLGMSCKTQKEVVQTSAEDPQMEAANRLAQKYIITDGHVDLPYRLRVQNFRLEREYLGIPIETDKGDFDYVRAKKGGLDAPFMSIFIPSRYQKEKGSAKILADSLIDMVNGIIEAHPDKFGAGRSPAEVQQHFEHGRISLPMGMENGAPLEDISDVEYFQRRGIRYVTLTHSKDNQICDSSYDTTRTWNGLSPYGEQIVREINRVGIMVDISHVSDQTFYQVMDITKVPVIASHSSCRKYTPGFERNMDDDMIKKLGQNGGVIQINFGSSFLDGAYQKKRNALRDELREILEKKELKFSDAKAKPIIDKFQKKNPILFADVETVADHIDHVVSLVGIDHVGIGSDFDGVGDSLPTGLKDVSQYPNLIKSLLKRGYTEEDIAKICYQNVFRVWNAVESYAAAQ